MVSLTEYVPMITATELEKTTVARLRRCLLPFLFIMFVVN